MRESQRLIERRHQLGLSRPEGGDRQTRDAAGQVGRVGDAIDLVEDGSVGG